MKALLLLVATWLRPSGGEPVFSEIQDRCCRAQRAMACERAATLLLRRLATPEDVRLARALVRQPYSLRIGSKASSGLGTTSGWRIK